MTDRQIRRNRAARLLVPDHQTSTPIIMHPTSTVNRDYEKHADGIPWAYFVTCYAYAKINNISIIDVVAQINETK